MIAKQQSGRSQVMACKKEDVRYELVVAQSLRKTSRLSPLRPRPVSTANQATAHTNFVVLSPNLRSGAVVFDEA